MKPKTTNNEIQVFIIQPVYKTEIKIARKGKKKIVGEFGESIRLEREVFIKEAFLRRWFNKHDLRSYGEYIGSKGQTVKNRCIIFDRMTGKDYIVAHSIDEIHGSINEPLSLPEVGFKK